MSSRLSETYGGNGYSRSLFEEEYTPFVPTPTAEDFDRFNPGLKSYPIPSPITLLVDHREPPEIVPLLRRVPNLIVEVVSLEIGDYVVEDVMAIERKSPVDFARSVMGGDRRLFHQAHNMIAAGYRSIVLVEGDVYANRSMTIQQVDGMLSYLTMTGIHLFHSRSLQHSASVIAKIARHMVFGLGYPDPVLSVAQPKNPKQTGMFLLSTIPGVSATLSFRLIQHFGSVKAVALATNRELVEVNGVGKVVAEKIVAAFNT